MKYVKRNIKKGLETSTKVEPSDYNHYNRPLCTQGEKILGESVVSVGGYIDSLELIGQLLDAGENLQALRMAMSGAAYNYDEYDEAVAENEIILPRSRMSGFDLVDWTNLKRDIDGKIELIRGMVATELAKNNDNKDVKAGENPDSTPSGPTTSE